ncbi:MAG: histidine--tRNA ligase [Bacilli bacterium]|nr:histidine--tRNA ligase [Bacilli bacterium]
MKIQNVKGGYDFLPKEQKIRNYINNTLRKTFEKYGFQPIETPILCYYDILSDKYDEENDILKEIYKLRDQGERKLGLRYDLTVPFAKFIALNKNQIKLPFKRYEIAKAFRDGPVRVGRDREFTQCDADVVGLDGQLIEAELMSLFVKAFNELNIEIIIKYNSRNLMTGLILESGIDSSLVQNVTTIIDKKDKLTDIEFKEKLFEIGLSNNQVNNITKYFDLSLDSLIELFQDTSNEKIKLGLQELNNLSKMLKSINIDSICIFSSSLARGQNYYTGNVFEVYEKNGKINGSIGAGGRYDKMIGDFINDGNKYPTVGISFGLSSIYELLKDNTMFNERSNTDIYIIPLGTEIESLKIANMLRYLDYNVEIEMKNKKLKKSLDYANKEKIPYVIILGEDEIKKRVFCIKDMFNNSNLEIEFDNLDSLKNIINLNRK